MKYVNPLKKYNAQLPTLLDGIPGEVPIKWWGDFIADHGWFSPSGAQRQELFQVMQEVLNAHH